MGISLPPQVLSNAYALLYELADPNLPRMLHQKDRLSGFTPFWQRNGTSRAAEQWRQLLRSTTALQDFSANSGPSQEEISRVKAPALAIFGEFSRYLPILRKLKQRLPNCRAVIVPGVGHFHPVIKPDIFVQNLQEFLSDLDGSMAVSGD
jgi:pimeloyl-ACP methyl ester carboxylesterase